VFNVAAEDPTIKYVGFRHALKVGNALRIDAPNAIEYLSPELVLAYSGTAESFELGSGHGSGYLDSSPSLHSPYIGVEAMEKAANIREQDAEGAARDFHFASYHQDVWSLGMVLVQILHDSPGKSFWSLFAPHNGNGTSNSHGSLNSLISAQVPSPNHYHASGNCTMQFIIDKFCRRLNQDRVQRCLVRLYPERNRQDVRDLLTRMLQITPASRCSMGAVVEQLHALRRNFSNWQEHFYLPLYSDVASSDKARGRRDAEKCDMKDEDDMEERKVVERGDRDPAGGEKDTEVEREEVTELMKRVAYQFGVHLSKWFIEASVKTAAATAEELQVPSLHRILSAKSHNLRLAVSAKTSPVKLTSLSTHFVIIPVLSGEERTRASHTDTWLGRLLPHRGLHRSHVSYESNPPHISTSEGAGGTEDGEGGKLHALDGLRVAIVFLSPRAPGSVKGPGDAVHSTLGHRDVVSARRVGAGGLLTSRGSLTATHEDIRHHNHVFSKCEKRVVEVCLSMKSLNIKDPRQFVEFCEQFVEFFHLSAMRLSILCYCHSYIDLQDLVPRKYQNKGHLKGVTNCAELLACLHSLCGCHYFRFLKLAWKEVNKEMFPVVPEWSNNPRGSSDEDYFLKNESADELYSRMCSMLVQAGVFEGESSSVTS